MRRSLVPAPGWLILPSGGRSSRILKRAPGKFQSSGTSSSSCSRGRWAVPPAWCFLLPARQLQPVWQTHTPAKQNQVPGIEAAQSPDRRSETQGVTRAGQRGAKCRPAGLCPARTLRHSGRSQQRQAEENAVHPRPEAAVPRRGDSAPFAQAPSAWRCSPSTPPLVGRPPLPHRHRLPHHRNSGCPQRAPHPGPGSSALSASCHSQRER